MSGFAPPAGGFAVEARGLAKRFGSHVALDQVEFTLRERERLAVLGPNGAGKTTLIAVLATLTRPSAGTLRVMGYDSEAAPNEVRRRVGVVAHQTYLYQELSARENLLFYGRLYGVAGLAERVDALLTLVDIYPRRHEQVANMSRGMQQKVAVARAFLTAPVLLVLDEPTTGLDPASKRDVQAFIREVRDSHDATVLLMSHDMDEIARLCDRMAVLDDGRIVAQGTPASLAAPGETLEDAFIRLTGHALGDTTNERSERGEPAGVGEEQP